MGWMASWVGVQGVGKETVLEALGFVETGRQVDPGSGAASFSVGEIDGWVIVFSEDFEWGSPARAIELSRLGRTVSLQFEDKVEMTAIACEACGGKEVWRVSHVNDEGDELVVSGAPPVAFASIRDGLLQQQQASDGSVDYLHEVPLETAKATCGYRADDDERPFVALRRATGRHMDDEEDDLELGASFFGSRVTDFLASVKRLFGGG